MIATKIWTGSASEGRAQAAHALQLFGRVEIYQVHKLVAWQTQLRMLEELLGEGKVLAAGATHYLPSVFAELCDVMQTRRIDMIHLPYNTRLHDAERRAL